MPHFEVTAFLTAAIGLLGLISFCLLVFGRLGVGSIIAFLAAGVVIEQVRDPPVSTVLALRGVAELGVVLLLFLIGLEIRLDELRRLGRDILAFGLPQIGLSALVIGLYVWWRLPAGRQAWCSASASPCPRQWSWFRCLETATNYTRPGVARRVRSSWLKTWRSYRCCWWSR